MVEVIGTAVKVPNDCGVPIAGEVIVANRLAVEKVLVVV